MLNETQVRDSLIVYRNGGCLCMPYNEDPIAESVVVSKLSSFAPFNEICC